MNSLIIYFSRAGENYVNGQILNLKNGNTEIIAKKIAELINGNLYKIEPIVEYSKDYSECLEETINDKKRNARPELKHYLKDLNNYLKRSKLKLNKQEQQAILKAYNKAFDSMLKQYKANSHKKNATQIANNYIMKF